MARPIEHTSYGPGKFEGESCIARFAYHVSMDGMGEYICTCPEDAEEMSEDICEGYTRIDGPFDMVQVGYFERMTDDEMCQECVDYLLTLSKVDVEETDQGFVYATA